MGAYEPMEKYVIVRPFVALNKKNLLLPLSLSSCTDFVIDNLDQDRVGQRAWVRHEILPELAGHESHINERLAYFAEQERAKKAILARLAQDLVIWSDKQALISLDSNPEPLLIEIAVKSVLKKLCKDMDLRQARTTVEKLAGLDRASKKFIVKDLETKKFALPGAQAFCNGKEIVIKRV